jgi:hypothetical protein
MDERPVYGPKDCYRHWHLSGHVELDRRTLELIHEEALKQNAREALEISEHKDFLRVALSKRGKS